MAVALMEWGEGRVGSLLPTESSLLPWVCLRLSWCVGKETFGATCSGGLE